MTKQNPPDDKFSQIQQAISEAVNTSMRNFESSDPRNRVLANQDIEEIQAFADQVGAKLGKLISATIVRSVLLMQQETDSKENQISNKSLPQDSKAGIRILLNASQTAAVLYVSKTDVYRLMRTGELPTVRIGSSVRFRPNVLEEFIKKNVVYSN